MPGPEAGAVQVVEVRIVGNEVVTLQKIGRSIRTRAGRPYDRKTLEEDVRRLSATRMFLDVKTSYRQVSGGIVVIFEVVERPMLRYVKYVGNKKLKEKALQKETGLNTGASLDPYAVEEGRRKIEELYKSKGFNKAQVKIIEGNKQGDRGAVYLINEGPKEKILWVNFVGNTFSSGERLKTQIQSKPGILWLFGGSVDRQKIDGDIDRLKSYYHSFGFFRAEVGRELEFNEKGDWLTLNFYINEGPRYAVDKITVIGNSKFKSDELLREVKLKSGQYFNQAEMDADVATMSDQYGGIGYIFTKVEPEVRFHEEPGQLDVVYHLAEGDRYRIGRINIDIKGENPHTKITTVLNRLSLRPGDIVDIRELRASERRLKASGLFLVDPTQGNPPKIVVTPPEMDDSENETEVAGRPKSPKPRSSIRGQSPDPEQPARYTLAPVATPPTDATIDLVMNADGSLRLATPVRPAQPRRPAAAPVVRYQSPDDEDWYGPAKLPVSGASAADAPTTSAAPRSGYEAQWRAPSGARRQSSSSAIRQVSAEEPLSNDRFVPVRPRAVAPVERPVAVGGDSGYSSTVQSYIRAQQSQTVVRGQNGLNPFGGRTLPTASPAMARPVAYQQPAESPQALPDSVPLVNPSAGGQVQPGLLGGPAPPSFAPGVPDANAWPGAAPPSSLAGLPSESPPLDNSSGIPQMLPQESPLERALRGEEPTRTIDPTVQVGETQTGRLMLGVGINSDAGLIGSFIVDEQNFDWTRLPRGWEDIRAGTAFRGAGQQFRLEAVPGTQVQRYLVSFREPYLFDTQVGFGLSGYFFDRRYVEWDEQRLGVRPSLSYQFNPDLSGTLSVGIENVNIHDPQVPTPPSVAAVLGNNMLYHVRAALAHDTRDSAFLATEGHLIELAYEQVFGDFNYPRGTIDARQYFLMHQRPDGSGRHVMSVRGLVGITGHDTPVFENFFAGGFSTLRGFDFRGASPREMGVLVGGEFELLGSVEYMFPITADDMLRSVVFCDFGTVEPSVKIEGKDFRISPGVGLRITVPALGPAPIALDLAVPVMHAEGDDIENFSFYVGWQH